MTHGRQKFTDPNRSLELFVLRWANKGLWTDAIRPGCAAHLVTCLATDASLTADTGVGSSIPAQFQTLVEIDHEIISTVILLPSAESFKKGCCQYQAKVCVDRLFKLPRKKCG